MEKKYIKFMTGDAAERKLYWYCDAIIPDGTHCLHSAEWNDIDEIQDAEVEALAIALMQDIHHER